VIEFSFHRLGLNHQNEEQVKYSHKFSIAWNDRRNKEALRAFVPLPAMIRAIIRARRK
jgi:hypothetical protein